MKQNNCTDCKCTITDKEFQAYEGLCERCFVEKIKQMRLEAKKAFV